MNMLRRCNSPRVHAYKHYGARGIQVCKRWEKFENFREDMGPRLPGMTLERINVDGNYEPSNCAWVLAKEQAKNTRRNIRVELAGELVCLKSACSELGIPYSRTLDRMKKLGWSFEQAITEPKKINGTMYAQGVGE